ncbi:MULTISPECIES: SDR family NAD(P)-dependent oxidoreductase [unclassified Burkholderia]|uniref:SDR family NAD(P)-dependent oxidoreductase n=1 Tax=unclassified Burkholderia TaxID=2613784 RepID=UPI002AAF3F8F|nr:MULTISPECIES: SDR family NAD(P)-dependent oxidoreductase [unclassified Burkholderia]
MRTVAITSASAGGGRAATHAFVRRGANVAVPARDPRALHDIACEVHAYGVEAPPIAVDVGDAAARKLNR